MPDCPQCALPLNTVFAREGLHYRCPGCHSHAATIPQIRRLAGDKFATSLIRQINTNMTPSERACPFCGGRMRSFTSQSPAIELDGCRRCSAVWYDAGEFELMPEGAVSGTNEATVCGHFPLTMVSGAGAAARNSIGIVVVAGMALGTVFTLLVNSGDLRPDRKGTRRRGTW